MLCVAVVWEHCSKGHVKCGVTKKGGGKEEGGSLGQRGGHPQPHGTGQQQRENKRREQRERVLSGRKERDQEGRTEAAGEECMNAI